MSIEVSSHPPEYSQETDHESWHYESIEEIRSYQDVGRGEEFITWLDLIPATDYFGMSRAIALAQYDRPVSTLPPELVDELWAVTTYLYGRGEKLRVAARIWTSPEDRDYYASVRIDLPPVGEVEDDVREKLDLGEDFDFPSNPHFQHEIEDYLSETWRKTHGMSDETYKARMDALDIPTTGSVSEIDWNSILQPDGTPRANWSQRGTVRGAIGKHFPGNKAPRIDYATVGQCRKILDFYGEPTRNIDRGQSMLVKILTWVTIVLLAIVGLIGIFTPPIGWIFTTLVMSPFVYHYWTRRKLKPPFGKQQG